MRLIPSLALITLVGCAPGVSVSSYEDCLDQYAISAGTQKAARYAAQFCQVITGDVTDPEQLAFATCMLPKLRDAGSDAGVQAAARVCHAQ